MHQAREDDKRAIRTAYYKTAVEPYADVIRIQKSLVFHAVCRGGGGVGASQLGNANRLPAAVRYGSTLFEDQIQPDFKLER